MTLKEAGQERKDKEGWDISPKTLYDNCTRYNVFIKEKECRKSGGIWLVTRDAMIRKYGIPNCDRFYETHHECGYCKFKEECQAIAETLKPNPDDYEW
ncbi:MAG: hypothetical protein MJA82_12470 [Clostridia bacterium]|nr:hypothetical protein [Clostridia bacterium]